MEAEQYLDKAFPECELDAKPIDAGPMTDDFPWATEVAETLQAEKGQTNEATIGADEVSRNETRRNRLAARGFLI